MTNAELIKALRYCADDNNICTEIENCGYFGKEYFCQDALLNDAADALEAAEKRIAELMPKEGAWIDLFGHDYKCSVCGEWYKMDGTPETEDMNYCPNCGARMKGENDEQIH